jgi:hypothetical protein
MGLLSAGKRGDGLERQLSDWSEHQMRIAVSLFDLLAQHGGDQLVAAFPDLDHDTLSRYVESMELECATPCLDVGGISIDQCPVCIEDHGVNGHVVS